MSREKISSGDKDFDGAIMKFFPPKKKQPSNTDMKVLWESDPQSKVYDVEINVNDKART